MSDKSTKPELLPERILKESRALLSELKQERTSALCRAVTHKAILSRAEEAIKELVRTVESMHESTRAQSPAQAEWLDIESAPKDGTRILICKEGKGGYSWQGYWDIEIEPEGGQCWREESLDMERCNPTHWMPLPQPPKEQP